MYVGSLCLSLIFCEDDAADEATVLNYSKDRS